MRCVTSYVINFSNWIFTRLSEEYGFADTCGHIGAAQVYSISIWFSFFFFKSVSLGSQTKIKTWSTERTFLTQNITWFICFAYSARSNSVLLVIFKSLRSFFPALFKTMTAADTFTTRTTDQKIDIYFKFARTNCIFCHLVCTVCHWSQA